MSDLDKAMKEYLDALKAFRKVTTALIDQAIKNDKDLIKIVKTQKKVLLK